MKETANTVFYVVAISLLLALSPWRSFGQTGSDTTGIKRTSDTAKVGRPVFAGTKATVHRRDTLDTDSAAYAKKHVRWQPNPKKAGMYSSIVPGFGQLYNRQYWKLPIVYGVVAVSTYFITTNLTLYQSYRKAYINRLSNPAFVNDDYGTLYTVTQLKQLQDDRKKSLDMIVLFSGIGYAMQIMDAVTSAHLKNFDMSRDISMQLKPVVYPNGAGLGLVMNFK